jgi:hypothetical protein
MLSRKTSARDKSTTFYCFSPPVMIATFLIEIGLAAYAIWRYKWSTVTRLSVLLLVALSLFQLAEYMVCQGIGGDSLIWSRIGYVAITLLPAAGLHLILAVAKDKRRWLVWPGYIAAAAFTIFFALVGRSIEGHICMGNYVIFQLTPGSGGWFAVYYFILLGASLMLGLYHMSRKRQAGRSKRSRQALAGLMFGYAIFIIPTTAVHLLNPETLSGLPSIMCGFGVLLALALGLIVMPNATERKKR